MPFTHCHSLTAIHSLPFTHCHSLTAIHSLPSTHCHSLTAIHSLPSTHCHPLTAIHSLPFTHCHPLTAIHRLDQYIFGHPDVSIHTDHRPLEAIMNKSLLSAPKRIQSMMLALQRYALSVKWKPGKEQVTADWLSRQTRNCQPTMEPTAREHVFQLQQHETQCKYFDMIDPKRDSPVSSRLYDNMRTCTERDTQLQQLSHLIATGWPTKVDDLTASMRPWWTFRDELATHDKLIYKGARVAIPTEMQFDVLQRLHISHQGAEATLRRARQTVFWHGMAQDIKTIVHNCPACTPDAPEQQRETLRSHSIPERLWTKVGMDIFTHNFSNYLVITDYLSDYFEFDKLSEMTAASVIDVSKKSFARLGSPLIVHSANGPQFTAREFARFSA